MQRIARKTGLKLVITLAAGLMVQTAQALPVIDFGVAGGYSGFFFGDVKAQNDVEGRLAVGGNFTGNGSIGYRAPHGSSGPSLVVGGNAHFNSNGGIFNGPTSNVDTNLSVGPITEYQKAQGYGVYGGTLSGKTQGMDLRQQAGMVDFGQAETQLRGLSSQLGTAAATGRVEAPWSDTKLTGSGQNGVIEFFDLNAKPNWENKLSIGTLELSNVAADSWVVINVRNAGDVSFTGNFLGLFDDLRGRVLFNFENASNIRVGTFVEGSILAPGANFLGQGHVEGTVIGQSMSQAFEIGYEPFVPTSPIPEPESYALMLAGLGVIGFLAKRRRQPR